MGPNQSTPRGIDEGSRFECGNLLEAGLGFAARCGVSVPQAPSLDRISRAGQGAGASRSYDGLVSSR